MPNAQEICREAIDGLDLDGRQPGSAPAFRAEDRIRPPAGLPYGAASSQTKLLAVSRQADGVVLLGPGGAIRSMNEAAIRMLTAGDGLALVGDLFVAHRPPESRRLSHLLGEALGRLASGQMLVSRRLSGRPYLVRLTPVPPTDHRSATHGIACIMLVRDLSHASLSPPTLRELFGLTRREADLAAALVRLGSLRKAAADAAMAINTARNHLRTIFVKTSVNSQVRLVALLGALA